jgi:hypothetical protein
VATYRKDFAGVIHCVRLGAEANESLREIETERHRSSRSVSQENPRHGEIPYAWSAVVAVDT